MDQSPFNVLQCLYFSVHSTLKKKKISCLLFWWGWAQGILRSISYHNNYYWIKTVFTTFNRCPDLFIFDTITIFLGKQQLKAYFRIFFILKIFQEKNCYRYLWNHYYWQGLKLKLLCWQRFIMKISKIVSKREAQNNITTNNVATINSCDLLSLVIPYKNLEKFTSILHIIILWMMLSSILDYYLSKAFDSWKTGDMQVASKLWDNMLVNAKVNILWKY